MKGGEKRLRVAMVGQKTILSRKGGVEVVVKELSERMVKKGIIVTCYNRREKGERRPKEYCDIKMKYALTIKIKGLAALSSSFFATIMILFSKNNIVHYHAEGPCAWMWIIKFFSKKRIVATIHGLDWQRAKWGKTAAKWIKRGEKNAVKYADVVIVLSENMRKYFLDQYNRETIYIPNGVSTPEIIEGDEIYKKYGLRKSEYILYLGRITPEKGVHYLVEAYKKIETRKKLVIAGGADDAKDYYESLLEKTKQNNNILFIGAVYGKTMEELFSNAYIYILPSDLEGMPLSLLEAMSYGKCCITSDISECKEVIADCGITFRKSDIESLSKSIRETLKDAAIVKKYGKKAMQRAHDYYSWDTMVMNTIREYKGVIL